MLSERAVELLAALTYRPDAEWAVNILPFGSVYWDDEMPAMQDMFDRPDDMFVIMSMFGLRIRMWDGEQLGDKDREMWNAVQKQVPIWAFFQRLTLSDEQSQAREKAERQVEQEFESLSDASDENC